MKKYLLAAILVLASTSALADRVVSGTNHPWKSASKAEACDDAKLKARDQKRYYEHVEGYSKCDCDQDENKSWRILFVQ